MNVGTFGIRTHESCHEKLGCWSFSRVPRSEGLACDLGRLPCCLGHSCVRLQCCTSARLVNERGSRRKVERINRMAFFPWDPGGVSTNQKHTKVEVKLACRI